VPEEEPKAAGGAGKEVDSLEEIFKGMIITETTSAPAVKNKGTGAGGANTNLNGKTFEEKTSNRARLLDAGFAEFKIPDHKGKYDVYLQKKVGDNNYITYLSQGGLKSYFKWKFDVELFRKPDEAYLIQNGDSYVLKVLEKKNQNGEGSVDTKLLAGPSFIREYSLCLPDTFKVNYAFCVSTFLENQYKNGTQKSKILKQILEEANIPVFFGDQTDYFTELDRWISS
jgi:hypothetical protein